MRGKTGDGQVPILNFPEPADGYDHRYAWNCGLINQMVWWPTLSKYERGRLNEMLAWNHKFLELQAQGAA
jgi:hypothetical protein